MARQERSAWLVSYDISGPKRLRRTARYLEAHAIRLQNSVFLGLWPHAKVEEITNGILAIIRARKDDVRMYRIPDLRQTPFVGVEPIPDGALMIDPRLQILRLLHAQHSVMLPPEIFEPETD